MGFTGDRVEEENVAYEQGGVRFPKIQLESTEDFKIQLEIVHLKKAVITERAAKQESHESTLSLE